ncbi:MAG: AAA family ATPase [Candidatus Paceibacterota bacterium]
MYLKRLHLSGFKSFARDTELSFTTPITAIVGPNGSGKSNIAEAIRFVLGEQSMKSLRSKRGEDLIFNGSKTLSRASKASVAISFDNTKKTFPLDYDEVELKRVVYRDTTNQYFLNGKRVRLKDIIETLSAIHIGASSHHIISQGEADRILNASIKERRVMIEDALGLRIYQYKKAESERKLAKTKENINHVEALNKEITPHLKFLEKQVKKIEEAEVLKKALIELYKEYFALEEGYLTHHRLLLGKKRHLPEVELREVETQIKESEEGLLVLEGGEVKSQKRIDLEEKLSKIAKEKDEHSRRLGRLEGMLLYEEKRKKRAQKEPRGERIEISAFHLRDFIGKLKNLIKEGEGLRDSASLSGLWERMKNTAEAFYQQYEIVALSEEKQEETKIDEEALSHQENEEDTYEHLVSQKRLLEEKERTLTSEERDLQEKREKLTHTIEKERVEERAIEQKLFSLRTRKTELLSEIEMVGVHEERLTEEERRFNVERTEAGHLLGLSSLRYEKKTFSESVDKEALRISQEEKRRKAERMKVKIEDLVGGGGDELLAEYEEVKERAEYLEKELVDLRKSTGALLELIGELGEKIDKEFKEGVLKINKEFGKLFETMFSGGVAKVALISPPSKRIKRDTEVEDEFIEGGEEFEEEQEEGIDIEVSLPHKRLKGLHMLSGGERTLTSIALIFALSLVNPPPFLVLDETDAALDEANSRKYGEVVKELSKKTQFIIITHNRETMNTAHVLYGVTSTFDAVSRILSLKFDEAEELAQSV